MVADQLRRSIRSYLSEACFLGFIAVCCNVAAAGDLMVTVEHLKANVGNVRVALFNDPKTFPKTVLIGQKAPVAASAMTLTFKDLRPGRYAVSAMQDLNRNDKLDTNAFGIPKEPYGFSQNARGRFGPPSFDNASFDYDGKDRVIHIQVD